MHVHIACFKVHITIATVIKKNNHKINVSSRNLSRRGRALNFVAELDFSVIRELGAWNMLTMCKLFRSLIRLATNTCQRHANMTEH